LNKQNKQIERQRSKYEELRIKKKKQEKLHENSKQKLEVQISNLVKKLLNPNKKEIEEVISKMSEQINNYQT